MRRFQAGIITVCLVVCAVTETYCSTKRGSVGGEQNPLFMTAIRRNIAANQAMAGVCDEDAIDQACEAQYEHVMTSQETFRKSNNMGAPLTAFCSAVSEFVKCIRTVNQACVVEFKQVINKEIGQENMSKFAKASPTCQQMKDSLP